MKYKLGAQLKALRKKRNLTGKDVAGKAGLSTSLLSQIENNRVSPSLDTLIELLEVYGITPDRFFKNYETGSRVEIINEEDREIFKRKGFKYEKLCGISQTKGKHSFNAFFLELLPGNSRGNFHEGHMGRELGIVVSGCAELIYGEKKYELKKGDSISFFSQIPHVLKNSGTAKFQAYWIVTPADGEDYFGENGND
ncbi:MAG: XRE family transcriptional regulator [Desulfobacteraceae bacterium]